MEYKTVRIERDVKKNIDLIQIMSNGKYRTAGDVIKVGIELLMRELDLEVKNEAKK